MQSFSILMSIYEKTDLSQLKECMDSLFCQTMRSDDIVIAMDGVIDIAVLSYLHALQPDHPELNLVAYTQNRGVGGVLSDALPLCKNELIGRMDSDDICVSDRFETQIRLFEEFPDLSVTGSDIAEFMGEVDNVIAYRRLAYSHEDIAKFLKKRCPFNQMTVMFKKQDVLSVGGYVDWHYEEDYYLWLRMYLHGCRFLNVDQILCYVRVDEKFYQRRGGKRYFKSEKKLFRWMRRNKIIGFGSYFSSILKRLIVEVLLPNNIRAWAFKHFVRRKK